MIKALAIKELREVRGIACLGLAAELLLVLCRIGLMPFGRYFSFDDYDIPFIDPGFGGYSLMVAIALALALGFWQSVVENARGTYQFLLHRPLHREAIFLTKLGTGVIVFLACIGVPILIYAVWAATPGTHPSPFEWSMMSSVWQMCLVVPLLYIGAFMSGLRPARWFGTRLLPLAAIVPFVVPLLVLPWPWFLGLPALIALYGVLVSNICYVARMRDFS